jgi:IS5 family transposase
MSHRRRDKESEDINFEQLVARQMYGNVRRLGDRLLYIRDHIDWKPFRRLVASVFNDNDKTGGRPHTDELVVVRALLLQGWYGLSDEELEYMCNDRLSFRNFLGYPDRIPDFTTVWKIRERLQQAGIDQKIWDEIQRQLIDKGYNLKKGVIQDATFIDADQGKKRIQEEKKAEKAGEKIEYTEKQQAHQDKDGTFAKKGLNLHYGYKDHIKTDVGYGFIRKMAVTSANVNDCLVQLVQKGDIKAYRDKGYFHAPLPKGVLNGTLFRTPRGRVMPSRTSFRNRMLAKVRGLVERPFAVIKRVFHGDRTFVKTLERVRIKEMFKGIAYNLYNLFSWEKKRLARAILV